MNANVATSRQPLAWLCDAKLGGQTEDMRGSPAAIHAAGWDFHKACGIFYR